jgi:hypothetical protein
LAVKTKPTRLVGSSAWNERWDALNDILAEQGRRLSPADRLRVVFALMKMAVAVNWHSSTPEEEAVAQDRWNRLRQHYGVRNISPPKKKSKRGKRT